MGNNVNNVGKEASRTQSPSDRVNNGSLHLSQEKNGSNNNIHESPIIHSMSPVQQAVLVDLNNTDPSLVFFVLFLFVLIVVIVDYCLLCFVCAVFCGLQT